MKPLTSLFRRKTESTETKNIIETILQMRETQTKYPLLGLLNKNVGEVDLEKELLATKEGRKFLARHKEMINGWFNGIFLSERPNVFLIKEDIMGLLKPQEERLKKVVVGNQDYTAVVLLGNGITFFLDTCYNDGRKLVVIIGCQGNNMLFYFSGLVDSNKDLRDVPNLCSSVFDDNSLPISITYLAALLNTEPNGWTKSLSINSTNIPINIVEKN